MLSTRNHFGYYCFSIDKVILYPSLEPSVKVLLKVSVLLFTGRLYHYTQFTAGVLHPLTVFAYGIVIYNSSASVIYRDSGNVYQVPSQINPCNEDAGGTYRCSLGENVMPSSSLF